MLKDNIYSKKGSLIIFILLSTFFSESHFAKSTQVYPKIDRRIELLNIIYILASNDSIILNTNPYYVKKVHSFFERQKLHPVVVFTQNLIQQYEKESINILDWELPSVALHITNEFNIYTDINLNDTSDVWDNKELLTKNYVSLIKQFFLDSKAALFFNQQEEYYNSVSNYFKNNNVVIDIGWLYQYLAIKPTETYFPIISTLPATGAYFRANFSKGFRHTHTLMSCKYNENGLPGSCNKDYFNWAMLHESIHCYTNQVIDSDTIAWKKIGIELLKKKGVAEKVKNTFYNNWRYLLYETLVRTIDIKYNQVHKMQTTLITNRIEREVKNGFIWIPGLLAHLKEYEKNKSLYKNISGFSTELQKFLVQFIKEHE